MDKSDRFAVTLVDHGTFGFLPDVPSAYTQPLYGWFLAAIYLPFGRSWVAVGIAQTIVAIVTALLVLEIGTRLRSIGIGVVAALITTLHPYLVWHDVHLNREVLDGLMLAFVAWLALLAYEDRGFPAAIATGVATGIAILGNARLALLPLVLAPYVAWKVRPGGRALAVGGVLVAGAALAVAPWVVRNKVEVGCFAITTDSRALWKANNPATYDVLARGGWIDDVPELPRSAAMAGARGRPHARRAADLRRRVRADAALPRRGGRLLARGARGEGEARRSGGAHALEPDPDRVRRERKRARPRGPAHRRARVHARRLRARARRPLPRAAALRRARAAAPRLQHARRDGVRGIGALSRRPGTSCSRCSPRSRSRGSGNGCALGGRATRRRTRAPPGRAPRSARRSAPA